MNALRRILGKVAILFGRSRFRENLDDEMAFHREQAEKDLIASGIAPEVARSLAARQFGNVERVRERSHEVVGFRVESVWQDVRFAVRQMMRNPGYALIAVFVLALGMGVSVAIFGFVDAALIQPLPYAKPSRLMAIDESGEMHTRSNISYQDYQDWRRMNKTLSSLDVYTGMGYLLKSASGSEPVQGARVSDGFFSTLGVKATLGRVFLPGEDQPGRAKIVVLDYGAWIKRFGGRRDIVGQSVNLNSESYTVVGVLPREFTFAPRGTAELWAPLLDPSTCEQRRSCHDLDGLGRLRDGVTMQQALDDLKGVARQLEIKYPGSNMHQGASVEPLTELIVGSLRPILLLLMTAAGLLLAIACVNVASLLLVRSESRRREIAVRGALGATRSRLTRQFITEGLLMASAGVAAGMLVSAWIMSLLKLLIPKAAAGFVPFVVGAGLNAHTGLFAAAVGLLATVLLAATPTMRLSFQPVRDGLAEGGRTAAGRFWRRMGANLVVTELAIAVVLLVGAGLLGQSFYRLLHVDLGFEPDHLATVQLMAPPNTTGPQQALLYRQIVQRVSALPGVQAAGMTTVLPASCNCNTDWIRIPGKPYHGEHNEVNERDVTPEYMATIKARVIQGRMFTDADDANKPRVIIINQTLARKYFPGEDPIGKMIGDGGLTPKSMRQIVGLIADVREGALDDELWPAEYIPMDQDPDNFVTLVARTAQNEGAMLPTITAALKQIDGSLGVYGEATMNQTIESSQTAILHRSTTWFVGGFAVIAFVLGVVGLYGVIAYSVSQRTREIGVRMALGAQRGQVYRMVMRQAGWLTAAGLGIGLAGSLGTSMLMRSLLFGVQAWDAPTLAGVAIALGIAAMAASFLPAHRAASVNPTVALRAE